jgi:mutator protein MutT
VALALFYRQPAADCLEVWTQVRTDDGIFHGLLEFPGGGIEKGETPLEAAVREVEEEVGIKIEASLGKLMGVYPRVLTDKTILLNVFLFTPTPQLDKKGAWLKIEREKLSAPYEGKIPYPNHQIIDDLFRNLYDA